MRAITLCACAALLSLPAGCGWGRRADEHAPADGNVNAAAAASPSDGAAPNGSAPNGEAPLPPGSDARAYFERGVHDYRRDRDAAAVEAFREAVRLDPEFAEAHYRLGLALSAAGQDEEAEKSFQEAVRVYGQLLKKDEKNSDALFFLGLSQTKLGEYDKAIKSFKESIRHVEEEDDDRYYELGLAQYKLAEYADSVRSLEKALEINPDNYPASDLLERARSGRERRESFIKRQEELRKKQGQRGSSNANLTVNGNLNGSNRNAAPAPTPRVERPRRAAPPD